MIDSVLIGGVFDPLHAGHLAYIREAKKHGSLICSLNDAPHKHQALVPIEERADLLYALGVDAVVIGPTRWAFSLRPKKYIKGKDWEGRLPPEEVSICDSLGIEIVYTDTSRQSSSQLLADYERRRNTEKLAALESWVSTQQSAKHPWEPVTSYDRDTRRAIETPQADILAEVFAGLSFIDYGFGYLVELLQERGLDAYGWDPHYKPDVPAMPRDVVICREVLEHLTVREIRLTVTKLVSLAKRFVYVTTRFTSQSHVLDFDTSDSLDPTHMTMLSPHFLRTLFVLEGCTRRADLEAKLDHRNLGRVLVYEVARD
jgi:cytidyltransferase-like protein